MEGRAVRGQCEQYTIILILPVQTERMEVRPTSFDHGDEARAGKPVEAVEVEVGKGRTCVADGEKSAVVPQPGVGEVQGLWGEGVSTV